MTDIPSRLSAALADRYRIERPLGEGGMATVYLAEDLKHDRKVALKVLKPELAAVVGAERFVAEIRTTANLRHPHILPLFDSGEADSFLYYVMPYVEGESLRERLDREKQLPVDEAVAIATKVAGALQAAHEAGVIHRDIKPANILLEKGEPVVADFGIALAVQEAGGGRLTETGLSLGTPYYMSPEQATGDRDPDARSDVYALGAVLYEMLTGEPPFTGSTAQAVLGRILSGHLTRPTEVRKSIAANVEAAVLTALERLPADRFGTAAEFIRALQDEAFRVMGSRATRSPASAAGVPTWAAGALLVLGLVVGATAIRMVGGGGEEPLDGVRRWTVGLPEGFEAPDWFPMVDITPDGERLVLSLRGPDRERGGLWVRERGSLELTPIPGTEEGVTPRFSADGSEVFFSRTGSRQSWSSRLDGAAPVPLAERVDRVGDVASGPDGSLVFSSGLALVRADRAGSGLDTIAVGGVFRWTSTLPGGGVLATLYPGLSAAPAPRPIVAVDVSTGRMDTLTTGVAARYAASGHLLWTRLDGTLMAAPFDAAERRLTGTPVALPERVSVAGMGPLSFAISHDGTLVYQAAPADVDALPRLLTASASGVRRAEFSLESLSTSPRLSPDGTEVARLAPNGSDVELWVHDLATGQGRRLPVQGLTGPPTWTREGDLIVVQGDSAGGTALRVPMGEGEGRPFPLTRLPRNVFETALAPGGRWLAAMYADREVCPCIRVVDLEGDSTVAELERALLPGISPDGRWLAYVAWPLGQSAEEWRVQVRPFPDVERTVWQVTDEWSADPVWGEYGDRLYFQGSDRQGLMEAVVRTEPSFAVDEIGSLFSRGNGVISEPFLRSYDVGPGDSVFAWFQGASGARPLVVVEGYFQELEERVGQGGGS